MVLAAVPVIDISPYRGGDIAARRALAAEVDRICREIGFMVISGHGVDPDLIAAVESVSRAFFDLPLEEKMRIVRPAPDVTRGYMPMKAEVAGAQPRRQCAGRPEREPDDRLGRCRRLALLHRARGRPAFRDQPLARAAGGAAADLRALLPRHGRARDRSHAPLRPGARPAREVLQLERRPLDQPAAGAQLSGAGWRRRCRASSAPARTATTAASPS